MELLTNIIAGYLKHNKRLVVPRFGAFIVKQPSGEIVFSELMRNDDGVLRSLLVAYGCNELSANGMIDRFAFEVRHKISQGQTFVIADFGTFSEGENNTILFRQKREPKVFGGNIKPPLEHFTEEKLKLQRIQRIRQQQSENLTGHSTHRKLRTSQAIITNNLRADNDQDIDLGKPDKYLRGLKYTERKGKKNEEERYGNERGGAGGSTRVFVLLVVALIIAVGGWFTWQWLERTNAPTAVELVTPTETIVEATDSLSTPQDDVAPATEETAPTTESGTAPATAPSVQTQMVTPLLTTPFITPQPGVATTTPGTTL